MQTSLQEKYIDIIRSEIKHNDKKKKKKGKKNANIFMSLSFRKIAFVKMEMEDNTFSFMSVLLCLKIYYISILCHFSKLRFSVYKPIFCINQKEFFKK